MFGASHGRFTFLLRAPGPQRALTLDGAVDLSPLGGGWSVVDQEETTAEAVRSLFVALSPRESPRGPGGR